MSKYDDLFEHTAPDDSVFTAKGVLNSLAEPTEIAGRDEQERQLATILNGVQEGISRRRFRSTGRPGPGRR